MQMLMLIILTFVGLCFGTIGSFTIDGVFCDEQRIGGKISFDAPFQGIIFSEGFHKDSECRYVAAESGVTEWNFEIDLKKCGTVVKEVNDSIHTSNEIVIQYSPLLQTLSDRKVVLKCELSSGSSHLTSIAENTKVPSISENPVDAWLDFKLESDESSRDFFQVGDKITVLAYIRHGRNYEDVIIKNCVARNVEDITLPTIKLLDEFGCSENPNLLTSFNISKATPSMNADKIGIARMNAFRFTDSNQLSVFCRIEICEARCSGTCSEFYPEACCLHKVSGFGVTLAKRSVTGYDAPKYGTRNFLQFAKDAFALKLQKSDLLARRNDIGLQSAEASSGIMNRAAIPKDSAHDSDLRFSSKTGAIKSYKLLTVTGNIIVLSHVGNEKIGRNALLTESQHICIPKVRLVIISTFLAVIVVSLLTACVSMAMYIRNMLRRNKISSYLLYSYR